MTFYVDTMPPTVVESRPLFGTEYSASPQGVAGHLLLEEMKKVLLRVLTPSQSTYGSAVSSEDLDYRHVTLPSAGKIRVRYKQPEPLRPRRFSSEEET